MNKSIIKLALFLCILLCGIYLLHYFHLTQFSPANIRKFILSFGIWAPILYILLYTFRPLVFFPAVLLTLTGGLTFGPWWGTFYDLIGASLGAYLAFGISRFLGRETIQRFLGNRWKKIDNFSGKYGFRTILFLRLIPLVPFDMVNYSAGLTKIRFRSYAVATTLGIIPGAFAYNYLGSSLHHLFSPAFIIALGLVALLSVVPIAVKRWKKRSESDMKETE